MVARRLAGYAVAMEVARRAEGPEVNGDLRKTVSRRSLVPSRELKRKGYTRMHKTLETLETLALRARVSKPVSAVLYIPVYTSTAWYNLYVYIIITRVCVVT